jgi:putative SOS response-associated peptidase YedK
MCGRFTLAVDTSSLQTAFPWLKISGEMTPRYNVAPTQPVAVVANTGKNELDFFLWGLIPSWAKDPKIGSKLINARSETLAEKPSFRSAYKRRRCLIFSDGFYEWRAEPQGRGKTPMYIHMKSGEPFAFAGLWESWHSPLGDLIRSCTIITTQANDLLAPIHHRMPVILPADDYDRWLDPAERSHADLGDLLKPYPGDLMETYPVSKLVNSPANDSPECVVPEPHATQPGLL